jgi:hypothetical protein
MLHYFDILSSVESYIKQNEEDGKTKGPRCAVS